MTVSPEPPVSASATVVSGLRLSRCWVRVATARLAPSLIVPESGASAPVNRPISVVLPAPFGPTMPMRSPRWMRIEKSETMARPS